MEHSIYRSLVMVLLSLIIQQYYLNHYHFKADASKQYIANTVDEINQCMTYFLLVFLRFSVSIFQSPQSVNYEIKLSEFLCLLAIIVTTNFWYMCQKFSYLNTYIFIITHETEQMHTAKYDWNCG